MKELITEPLRQLHQLHGKRGHQVSKTYSPSKILCSPAGQPQPVLMHGVVSPQVQHPAFALVEPRQVTYDLKHKTWTALSGSVSPTFHRRITPRRVRRNCRASPVRTHVPKGCDHCSVGYLHVLRLPALEIQAWPAENRRCDTGQGKLAFSFLKFSKFCASQLNRVFLIPALTIN